jgi:predicted phage-related endonuclease
VSYDVREYKTEAEWLEARRGFITSSDVPTLLGLGYESPHALWLRKLGPADEGAPKMRRRFQVGHDLEPRVAQWHEEETGRRPFRPADSQHYLCVNPALPWAAVTPDFVLMDGGGPDAVVEVKSDAFGGTGAAYAESKQFLYANAQAHQGMAVLEMDHAYVDVIFGLGHGFAVYPVGRDDALSRLILERGEEFHGFVTRREPPGERWLTDHEDTRKALAAIFDAETGEEVTLEDPDGSLRAMLRQWDLLPAKIRELENELEQIKNVVALRMGTATYGRVPGFPRLVKWHKQKRKGYTVEPSESRAMRLVKDASER